MNVGRLDVPVYLFSLKQVKDKSVSFVWVWQQEETQDYVWAERISAQVSQVQDSEQNRSERLERFRIREDERFLAPTARDAIGLFDGLFYYRIAGVQPDLKNEGYQLVNVSYVQSRPVIERVPNAGRAV